MNVTLAPEQLEWLKSEVDAGHFTSIDEAIAVAIADLKTACSDDLSWTKPAIEAARESVRNGSVMTTDEWFVSMDRYCSDFLPEGRNQPITEGRKGD